MNKGPQRHSFQACEVFGSVFIPALKDPNEFAAGCVRVARGFVKRWKSHLFSDPPPLLPPPAYLPYPTLIVKICCCLPRKY